jgi:hypothetical protein
VYQSRAWANSGRGESAQPAGVLRRERPRTGVQAGPGRDPWPVVGTRR